MNQQKKMNCSWENLNLWDGCILLQHRYTVYKCLLCSWEIFHRTICSFTLQDYFNWRHQFPPCWYCCCCMSYFSNQFFDFFKWYPFCHAHNIVQIRINHTFLVPQQFSAPCCAINHPTYQIFSHCPLAFT